jgi:single-stranded DNA-binding protein
MAIAFIKGELTRTPYFKDGDSTMFAACTLKETYVDREGVERLSGYHDVVAFGPEAQQLALYDQGDTVDVQANIRYRADNRFVGRDDPEKNPFVVQYVVMKIKGGAKDVNEDPFS